MKFYDVDLRTMITLSLLVGLPTYSLHCSSFFGLTSFIVRTRTGNPKKGTTMETIGTIIIGSDGVG